MNNIVIVGAGAVGGYFGGKLALAGAPVTFLVRERRYQQLLARGLRVKSVHGDFVVNPSLATSVDALESPAVVVVVVKNYHLQSILPELIPLVEQGAIILPLMNGVQHVDALVDAFGRDHVVGGACYVEATLTADGDVIQTSAMQDVVFGPLGSTPPGFLEELESWFAQAKINVTISAHIMADMWNKYLFLVTLSGITAATRKPIGAVLGDPVTSAFLRDMIFEAVAIGQANGAAVASDLPDTLIRRLASLAPDMTSSMHRDLEKGLPIELESLQGTLIEMGRHHGIDAPCFRAVYALLHPYSHGASS